MKNHVFLLFCIILFNSCKKETIQNDIIGDENQLEKINLTIGAQSFDHCNETWESTTANLIISGDGQELINSSLTKDLTNFELKLDYKSYTIESTKVGSEPKTITLSKEELQEQGKTELLINLESKVFEGDIIIKTIAEYNSFVAEEYGRVSGNLNIAGVNDLIELKELSSITSIGGGLRLVDLNSLTSISGLDNIKHLGGDITLFNNAKLTSISNLSNLSCIGSYLWIQDNLKLKSLEGLEKITSISEDLEIRENAELTSLKGLGNLEHVEGDIIIYYNSALTNIDALSKLSVINKSLEISANNKLSDLSGLENITTVNDLLQIIENSVTSLNGLENLTTVSGNLEIYNNAFLTNWCAIQSLFQNNGLKGAHLFSNCSFNPSVQDIIDGNCSP